MRRGLTGLVLLGLMTVMAGPALAQRSEEGINHIRRISGRYHSLAQAASDGFAATDECVAEPGLGGMGFHYVNGARIDTTLDVNRPEAVLYAPAQNGERRLVAVEYLVVDADQDLSTDSDRPSLFGHAFDGPMPGHFPGMPIHYDLHVWAWFDNPNGAYSAWNPSVSC
jgi:hypothetical protein